MIQIISVYGFSWHICNGSPVLDADLAFIKSYSPAIFHNDLDSTRWAFNKRLPSGQWLENIRFSGDLMMGFASIA